jgi:opacity protein-like surface antigen
MKKIVALAILLAGFASSASAYTVQDAPNEFNVTVNYDSYPYDTNQIYQMSLSGSGGVVGCSGYPVYPVTGVALCNPNAATSTTGPAFLENTISLDFSPAPILSASSQSVGILIRSQSDGHAIYLGCNFGFNYVHAVIAYGNFGTANPTYDAYLVNQTLGTTIPSSITVTEMQVGGNPAFRLLIDGGNTFDSGLITLTQTDAYDQAGQIGLRVTESATNALHFSNFTVANAVPEPTAPLLLLTSAIGALARRRRNRFF